MVVVVVALFGLLATASPFIYGWVTNRQRRAEKKEDWARQDAVAAQQIADEERKTAAAEEAARRNEERQNEIAAQAAEAAHLLEINTAIVAETASATHAQLESLEDGQKIIHSLVNSDMTAMMEATLLATEMMVDALKLVASEDTDGEMAAKIAAGEVKIARLKADLSDRLFRQEEAEAEVAANTQTSVGEAKNRADHGGD